MNTSVTLPSANGVMASRVPGMAATNTANTQKKPF